MKIELTSTPAREARVHTQELPDGSAVLLDTAAGVAYPVTESARLIWDLCDGQRRVSEIVDELEAHYDVDRATVEADSLRLIEELVAKQLLRTAEDGAAE